MGKGSIFISYRRQDSRHPARALFERLKAEFGASAVFYDVQSIGIGDNFPIELQQALDRARVVLAVISSGWQKTLIDNSQLTHKTDYVRAELKQACTRLQNGDCLLLAPVLIDSGGDFDPDALPADLHAELKGLVKTHAVSFADGSWDDDFNRLVASIRQFEKDHPGPHKSHWQRVDAVYAEVEACLANELIAALAERWRPTLDELRSTSAASTQIFALETALTAALPAFTASVQTAHGASPQALCLQITVLLASLAVDADAARAELDRTGAVSTQRKSIAALVRAVAREQRMVLLPKLDGVDARPDRTATANAALDAGVGKPWALDIAAQFWCMLHPHDPRQPSGTWSEADLQVLAFKIQKRAQRDGVPFVILCESDIQDLDAARATAQRFNAEPLLLASPSASTLSVLTENEHLLVAVMSDCIQLIGKLP